MKSRLLVVCGLLAAIAVAFVVHAQSISTGPWVYVAGKIAVIDSNGRSFREGLYRIGNPEGTVQVYVITMQGGKSTGKWEAVADLEDIGQGVPVNMRGQQPNGQAAPILGHPAANIPHLGPHQPE